MTVDLFYLLLELEIIFLFLLSKRLLIFGLVNSLQNFSDQKYADTHFYTNLYSGNACKAVAGTLLFVFQTFQRSTSVWPKMEALRSIAASIFTDFIKSVLGWSIIFLFVWHLRKHSCHLQFVRISYFTCILISTETSSYRRHRSLHVKILIYTDFSRMCYIFGSNIKCTPAEVRTSGILLSGNGKHYLQL